MGKKKKKRYAEGEGVHNHSESEERGGREMILIAKVNLREIERICLLPLA